MSPQQQYNLRWTTHTSNILQMFSQQLSTGDLVDVSFFCEGKIVYAHKMILSACSPHFQKLFEMHRADRPVILMNGAKLKTVRQMLHFMYRGEIRIAEEDLTQLLALADSLQIKGLCRIRTEKNKTETTTHTTDNNKTETITPTTDNNKTETITPTTDNNKTETITHTTDNNVVVQPQEITVTEENNITNNRRSRKRRVMSLDKNPHGPDELSNRNNFTKDNKQPPQLQGPPELKHPKLVMPPDLAVPSICPHHNKLIDTLVIVENQRQIKLPIEHQVTVTTNVVPVQIGTANTVLPSPPIQYYVATQKDPQVRNESPQEAGLRKNNWQSPTVVQQSAIVNNFDQSSLVDLILPDSDDATRLDSPELHIMDEIKVEPQDLENCYIIDSDSESKEKE